MGPNPVKNVKMRRKRLSKTKTTDKGRYKKLSKNADKNKQETGVECVSKMDLNHVSRRRERETPISKDPSILIPPPALCKPSQHGETRLICSMTDY